MEACSCVLYHGDPPLTGVNASSSSPYIVAKKSPDTSQNFRNISAGTSYFLFLHRDRKAYAKNPSYRLPLSAKN